MTTINTDNVFAIGFSGTRNGMTESQRSRLSILLTQIVKWYKFLGYTIEAHHGDCVGADAQFHDIVRELKVDLVVIHPPDVNDHLRAHCVGDVYMPGARHLLRNANIVRESTVMLTAPPTDEEQQRGGTWSTTRKAIEAKKLWYAVLPSGTIVPGPGKRS